MARPSAGSAHQRSLETPEKPSRAVKKNIDDFEQANDNNSTAQKDIESNLRHERMINQTKAVFTYDCEKIKSNLRQEQ